MECTSCITRAARQTGMGAEMKQDLLLTITGFKNVVAHINWDEKKIELFHRYLESAKEDNWTTYIMCIQGMLKLKYNLKKRGQYSTQLSVCHFYIMLNLANQWLIAHNVPKSLWLVDHKSRGLEPIMCDTLEMINNQGQFGLTFVDVDMKESEGEDEEED